MSLQLRRDGASQGMHRDDPACSVTYRRKGPRALPSADVLTRGPCMPIPNSAIYNYIVRELALTEHAPDEAPITIVCEPLVAPGGANVRGALSMRLKAGTTPEEARAIASTLQARVKGL